MQPTDERAGRPPLASLDFLGSTDELRLDILRSLRRSGGATPTFHHEGADRTGSIWVMVDGRGRVYSVEVPRRWRERIAVTGFAAALFDAYRAAVEKALNTAALVAYVTARRQEREDPTGRLQRGAPRPAARESGPRLAEPDARDWLRTSQATLDGVRAELDRLSRAETPNSGVERTVTSPNGYLTLRLLGQGLAGITGDAERIRAADPEKLRLDALAAFRAAALSTSG